MAQIVENDVIALLADLPEQNLRRGDVGTVIEVFTANAHHPGGYIVEFVDEQGRVYAQAVITNNAQIMPLHFRLQREAA